ncbi:MAG: hypothetical protein ABUS76_00555 [Candidatus Shikimatogenerans sp. Ttur]|uniref:Uncharacterized protein n=1 Tax=Candidatus Shikimatogenerans sp. Ttur TaxID=3158569 RepID=A0AAU7ZXK4_9FLAO
MKYKKKIIYNKIPFYKKKYFFNKKYKYIFLINSKFKKKFIFIQKINIFSNKIKKYKNIKKILLIKKKKIINLII